MSHPERSDASARSNQQFGSGGQHDQYQHPHISTLDVFDDTLESPPDLARGGAKRGLLKVGELTRPPRVPVSEVNDMTHQDD